MHIVSGLETVLLQNIGWFKNKHPPTTRSFGILVLGLHIFVSKIAMYFFDTQNESEFKQQLRIVRSQQMGFLSAASMESGSYQRGYEHIVR